MEPDGRPAAKIFATLVFAVLTAALIYTVAAGSLPRDNGVEPQVADRARPKILHAAEVARAHGDNDVAAYLEGFVRAARAPRRAPVRHHAAARR